MLRCSNFVTSLINELNINQNAEEALLKYVHLINIDKVLYNIYIELEYCPELRKFQGAPSSENALQLIWESYRIEDDWFHENLKIEVGKSQLQSEADDYSNILGLELIPNYADRSLSSIWNENSLSIRRPIDIPPTNLMQTPPGQPLLSRNFRGLKLLTMRVRDIMWAKSHTSYREVADMLIAELQPMGIESNKEHKNIRRRVYDALNVLKSAGVIKKSGKAVTWDTKAWAGSTTFPSEDSKRRQSLQKQISQRAKQLGTVLNKLEKMKGLLERNRNNPEPKQRIPFPYLVLAVNEDQIGNVQVRSNVSNSNVVVDMAGNYKMLQAAELMPHLAVKKIQVSNFPKELRKIIYHYLWFSNAIHNQYKMICIIALSLVAAEVHDHRLHPDKAYIRGEARRCAYNTKETTMSELENYHTFLIKMKTDFDDQLGKASANQKEIFVESWEQDWGEYYRKHYDLYLILSHVCEEMFESKDWVKEDPWDEDLDIRKREFHDEFIAEIRKEIKGDIQKIKSYKKQRNEL